MGPLRRVRARLTPPRARIEVNGAHEHEFMNPSGLRFDVACFAVAPGCVPDGERSTVWTWFPGRAWQVALCKGCGAHVGWSFHADGLHLPRPRPRSHRGMTKY